MRRWVPVVLCAILGVAPASARASSGSDPEPVTEDGTASAPAADDAGPVSTPQPPRLDGPYFGGTLFGGVAAVRVNTLDTPGPFSSFGGYLRFGQMVLPWLGLGLRAGGGGGYRTQRSRRQTLGEGGLLVDFNFVPVPKRLPLTLLGSFGFGGGAVVEAGTPGRSGFGGAMFGAAVRYEFFPGVMKYRPKLGGGFGLGPELGWLASTPAAAGRPMSHMFYLGLSMTGYFGD